MVDKGKLSIVDLTARDVMDTRIVHVRRDEVLSDVLGKMRKNNLFDLPVLDNSNFLGMVSYSMLTKRRNIPLYTHAEHIMYQPPEADEGTSLLDVAHLIVSNHSKAIPVVKRGKLVGVVTREGVCRILPEIKEFANRSVESVMTPNPDCIRESEDLVQVRNMMRTVDERFLPVVDGKGRLTGIVGSREMVALWKRANRERLGEVSGEKKPIEVIVKSIMRTAVTVTPKMTLGEAIRRMAKEDVPSVLVVDDGKPVGIVTLFDLMGLITKETEREGLYVEITGLDEEEHDLTDIMFESIEKYMRKISKMAEPRTLSVHVSSHHSEGGGIKYGLRAKLNTDHGKYYTSSYDWNLMKVLDEVMDQLDRMVTRDKERRMENRRNKKRGTA